MPILFRTLLLFTVIFWGVSANSSLASESLEGSPKKAILVTGASSGIGHQIALTLADNGYFVYAGARKGKDIAALSKLKNIQGVRLDVTVQDDIDNAVQYIKAAGRGLYGLVNNAGVFVYDPLIEISEKDMAFVNNVNVMGPYRVSKAFAPLIINSRGRITTIGSVSGLFAGKLFGPYSMSKHSMEAYSEALAGEMAKFDVQVSIVEPGNFRSNIMKNMEKRLKSIDEGERETQYRDEISRLASFVKSDRSHHASPTPVANAVVNFMSSENPKFRYLVTPNKREADYAIKRSLQKIIELNGGHEFSLKNEELINMLQSLLTKAEK